MADLLQLEIMLWFALLLAMLLAVLALRSAAMLASAPARRQDQLQGSGFDGLPDDTSSEHTVVRWSRVVQESNTAFWMYVNQSNEHRH